MRSILPIAALLIMLLIIGRIVYQTPHIETLWLTDSAHNWQSGKFVCPNGKHFDLVLGVPKARLTDYEPLIGRIVLSSDGKNITEFPFDTRTSTKASWLDRHNFQGYVLNWPTNTQQVRLQLTPGVPYEVEVQGTSSNSASVWLVFTQTQGEKMKSR